MELRKIIGTNEKINLLKSLDNKLLSLQFNSVIICKV